jgi:anti-anti-sigma factor
MQPLRTRTRGRANDSKLPVRRLVVAAAISRPMIEADPDSTAGAMRLYVRGDIELGRVPGLRAEFLDAVFPPDSVTDVILDCTDMTSIDPLGIELLVEIERALDQQGRRLWITHLEAGAASAIAAHGFASTLRIERFVPTAEIPRTR